jgi:hypothetical protein
MSSVIPSANKASIRRTGPVRAARNLLQLDEGERCQELLPSLGNADL